MKSEKWKIEWAAFLDSLVCQLANPLTFNNYREFLQGWPSGACSFYERYSQEWAQEMLWRSTRASPFAIWTKVSSSNWWEGLNVRLRPKSPCNVVEFELELQCSGLLSRFSFTESSGEVLRPLWKLSTGLWFLRVETCFLAINMDAVIKSVPISHYHFLITLAYLYFLKCSFGVHISLSTVWFVQESPLQLSFGDILEVKNIKHCNVREVRMSFLIVKASTREIFSDFLFAFR